MPIGYAILVCERYNFGIRSFLLRKCNRADNNILVPKMREKVRRVQSQPLGRFDTVYNTLQRREEEDCSLDNSSCPIPPSHQSL